MPGEIGSVSVELHGLIAAPYDQGKAEWGCYGLLISGAIGQNLGTGYQNTIDIINGCNTAIIASRLCADLTLGGSNDWYLPSAQKLYKIYLDSLGIGSFNSNNFYWVSLIIFPVMVMVLIESDLIHRENMLNLTYTA